MKKMSGREDYEERKDRKKEIYQHRVEKARANSEEYSKQYEKISSMIPLGQPILTDHYSASRHRNDIKRMDNKIRKAVTEDEKASYYENMINNIENNNSISSDDPKAIEKLEKKIQILEKQREETKKRDHECYELPYISREIKRLKDRIKELKELDELDFQEINFENGKVIHNKEQNRVQILFGEKPNEEVRNLLKRYGFKWARSQGAWQRLYNKNGIRSTKWVLEEMEKLKSKGE